jgi:SAM-dependent methyltransferase
MSPMSDPRITYVTWGEIGGDPTSRVTAEIAAACDAESVKSICDVGGGANPMLTLEQAKARGVERYVVTDIDAGELEKCPPGFEKVVGDATTVAPGLEGAFDLIFSHTVAEHVADPAAFHRTIFAMLRPGGQAIHFFPTLYEPAFAINRLLPEKVAAPILDRLQSGREEEGDHGKFPAYYRWCRGPSKRQLRRLEGVGFEVERYWAVFGHGYFGRVPALDRMVEAASRSLKKHHVNALTAYVAVTLRRPGAA